MAYSKHNPSTDTRYIADTIADMNAIRNASMGDTCLVVEDGNTYMANSQGVWVCPHAPTLQAHVSKEELAQMPFAKLMNSIGEHTIALGPTNDKSMVELMDELGPGLYTIYIERSCQEIPAGAKEIDSSCRGIICVDTYKIKEQGSDHFYGWALLFDHGGNAYSKYVRRSIASEWKSLAL